MSVGLLDRHLGADFLDVKLGGVLVELDQVGPVVIRHPGRTSPGVTTRPGPGSCSIAVYTDALAALPQLGDSLTIELTDTAVDTFAPLVGPTWDDLVGTWDEWAGPWAAFDAAFRLAIRDRFTGEVTDVNAVTTDDVTGRSVCQITAVTRRARLRRLTVGSTIVSPHRSPGAYALAVLTADAVPAGFTLGTFDTDGDVVWPLRAGDNIAEKLDALAAATRGELVEQRSGALSWQSAQHRDPTKGPAVTLLPSHVIAPATSKLNLGGLTNRVTFTGATSEAATAVDATSVDTHGEAAITLDVPAYSFAEVNDYGLPAGGQLGGTAQATADAYVAAYGTPRWTIDTLRVDLVRTVDRATAAYLLALDFGDLVAVVDFPTAGPFQASELFLEGWTETLTRDAYRMDLTISDAALTAL